MTVDLLIVLLTLAAPVLGATNVLWVKAVLLVGAAILWLASPPDRPLPARLTLIFFALGLTGVLSLLPAGLFPAPPWRSELLNLGVALPGTFSPQPWLTLEKALLLAGGLTWSWYLLSRSWQLPRRTLLGLYCAGILGLIVWSLMIYASGRGLILNDGVKVYGIFPNKNQMGNLCALGAILMLALGMEAVVNRNRSAWLWLPAVGVAVGGVLLTGSRAGVLVLGLGAFGWLLWASRLLRRPNWIALAVSCLFLLVGAMLAFQTKVLERFKPIAQAVAADRLDFRLLIHQDAAPLLGQSSWHGIGFGNFDPLFAQHRIASVNPSRAIHPESDWLWFGIEAGIPAALLALALAGLVLRRAWPFAAKSDRALRSAALVCSGLFLLHGFADVSGHRLGTLWPALFILALAVNTDGSAVRPLPRAALLVPVFTGVAGLLLLGAAWGLVPLPNSASLAKLKRQMHAALDQNRFADAFGPINEALRIAPLDWELYFARGTARALTQPATGPASTDFAVAQYLEPNPAVGFDIGLIWLSRDAEYVEKNFFLGREPAKAAEAWGALLRKHPDRAPKFFRDMLDLTAGYPEVKPYLVPLAGGDERLLLELALQSEGAAFDAAMREMLALDPDLVGVSGAQLRRLFFKWATAGDARELEAALEKHSTWLEFGWLGLGETFARRGEFERAANLARQFNERARLPAVPGSKPLAAARVDYAARPSDPVAAILFLQRLVEAGESTEALTVLSVVNRQSGVPAYLHTLEADLAMDRNEFERAWRVWRRVALMKLSE